MKFFVTTALLLFGLWGRGQGDQNLAVNEGSNLRLIIGIVITVVVIIAMYLLLRKEDK